MKRIYYYLGIFIFFCFLGNSAIQYSIARQIEEQSPYCLSFASIGANFLESRLDCWAKIKSAKSFAEMDQELINILTALELPLQKQNFQHQEHDGKKVLRYEFVCHQQYYLFTLQNESEATYFLLTSISNQDDKQMRQTEKLLKQTIGCKSYWRYKGVIQTRLDADGRKEYKDILVKCLHATEMDNYEDDNLTSITAYSKKLADKYGAVEVAGKKYNMQAALHSNTADNKTYIYLGFPLLLNDY